jgi:hypothetical protein
MGFSKAARSVNAALGIWLYVSTFVWPHTEAQAANVSLTGLLIALTALAVWSIGRPTAMRYVNAALGFWLLVSIGAFPTSSLATKVNSAVVGAIVFLMAMLPQHQIEPEEAAT